MAARIPVPAASADATAKADFLELTAFTTADRNRSIQDLVAATRRTGTTEALFDRESWEYHEDTGAEASQTQAEDAFSEIEDRLHACGGSQDVYPFDVSRSSIQLKNVPDQYVYTFLLFISEFGIDAGPKGNPGERLFEDVCCHAAEEYFGGSQAGAKAVHFGFPRRILPKDFSGALNSICRQIGDAVANEDAPRRKQQKDAKLDIVAWKHFPDGRTGKLSAFGQCAAGRSDWRQKASELQVRPFCLRWLREQPSVEPLRLFFIPRRLNRDDHRYVCLDGGILFDRCRIAYFAKMIPEETKSRCREWSSHVMRTRLS